MEGFTPTAKSHGFNPSRLWSGLRSGCRASNARRIGETKWCHRLAWAPPASRIMIVVHFSSQQPGIYEVNFWEPYERKKRGFEENSLP